MRKSAHNGNILVRSSPEKQGRPHRRTIDAPHRPLLLLQVAGSPSPSSQVGKDGGVAYAEAFGEFLSGGTATAAQIEFVNMIIEHLTDQGVIEPALLYEPPFTDIAPTGPDQVFGEEKVTRLFAKIRAINDSAVA